MAAIISTVTVPVYAKWNDQEFNIGTIDIPITIDTSNLKDKP